MSLILFLLLGATRAAADGRAIDISEQFYESGSAALNHQFDRTARRETAPAEDAPAGTPLAPVSAPSAPRTERPILLARSSPPVPYQPGDETPASSHHSALGDFFSGLPRKLSWLGLIGGLIVLFVGMFQYSTPLLGLGIVLILFGSIGMGWTRP